MKQQKRKRAHCLTDTSAPRALPSTFYGINHSTHEPIIQIDYTVPTWYELGPYIFFSCMAGVLLAVVLFMGVYYL